MYNFSEIEKKWIKYWDDNKTFATDVWDFSKPKYYALGMFPYPSAEGLHVGHPESYTAVDIVARMKRMQGYNVLNPMGFDSFGLPAEQFAIKTGNNPAEFTYRNIDNYIKQLKSIGFSYDWDRALSTTDPEYYKWTQWIFKQLYKDGLAKNVEMPVNWCEELGTVLANDEIVNGKSERGGYPVVKKMMKQWVIDVPAYAEKLLEGLEEIDWPDSTKEMQRNWIGKSEGAYVDFVVDGTNKKFKVFTTRPDTLFGATYCVLAPEHELVEVITTAEQKVKVDEYIAQMLSKTELERTDLNKEKTGVFLGTYAVNPANNKLVPIYISDYVLSTYGTGAIMSVPAHDQRDYEFAKEFDLEIVQVLDGGDVAESAFEGDGNHINSGFLDGLNKQDATNKMIEWLEQNGVGKKATNYRLREWVFARQRYWGEPMPIVYLENGKEYLLADNELPLLLPDLTDYSPKAGQTSPLERATDWVNVEIDGVKGKREVNTMPSNAASSWYFMRYIDPKNNEEFANKQLLDHWLPVDLYIGGAEHAVGHLIYSRFFNRYLSEKGYTKVVEPFKKLVHQGMILGENNIKMSKSLGNVVNPDTVIAQYGADALRVYEMFMGPLEATKPWKSDGIAGSKKFLDRVWRLYFDESKEFGKENLALDKIYHETVKKVSHDYETLNFNTAISQMMIFLNAVAKETIFPREYAEGFAKMLSPLAPFIAEEIWSKALGYSSTITYQAWPTYDESKMVESSAEIIAQVNGRVKVVLNVKKDLSQDEVQKLVMENDVFASSIEGMTIVKTIFVPNRLFNVVAK